MPPKAPIEPTETDRKFNTPQEIANEYGLHVKTVRKLFIDEPGVIRIGHPTLRHRRQHFTLRVPQTVKERVFGALTVKKSS